MTGARSSYLFLPGAKNTCNFAWVVDARTGMLFGACKFELIPQVETCLVSFRPGFELNSFTDTPS